MFSNGPVLCGSWSRCLLLEMANRGAARTAEVPGWLAEGLTQQLLASSALEVILPPPRAGQRGLPVNVVNTGIERKPNPLARARGNSGRHPPLSFEELSWPAGISPAGDSEEVFGASAQLFVDQLLQLENGTTCLRAMIEELPRYHNWQIAFLHGFHSQFQSLLDVEKWWALQAVQFTSRDLTQTWSVAESWRKLDEIVRPPVQVRTEADQLPSPGTVALQPSSAIGTARSRHKPSAANCATWSGCACASRRIWSRWSKITGS